MFSPYMITASRLEFPSLTTAAQLSDFVIGIHGSLSTAQTESI
jgi:hypothetical protein